MNKTEHTRLLHQAMGGDHGAFKALLDAHRLKLMACINVRLGAARSHAEEVFQEATLAAWQSLPGYRHDPEKFGAWLLRVGINKAIDKLRQLAGEPGQAVGQNAAGASSAPGISQVPVKNQKSPSSFVADQERDALLHQAVQQLGERQRMAVELHALEGFTYPETAEMMSLILETPITDGQVKGYYRDGKTRLEELLPRESAIFTDVAPKAEKK